MTREIFFFKNHGESEARRLVLYFFCFLNRFCSLVLIYFNSPQMLHAIKTLNYWSRDMLKFDFPEKGLGIVFPPHFVYDFSRKIFLMLYSINWPNFIVWLPLLLEILGNMCIAIVYYPGCDVMNFEINFIFLIKPFFLHDQNVKTKV